MSELVVLVDEQDNELGYMPKLEAHERGVLHRAFSVFLFNTKGQMLLQQRAPEKYHSAGLWSNACCSHPRPDEAVADAALRRLQEEMGMTCAVKEVFSFVYRAELDHGLTEHEYDHVLVGVTDTIPVPESSEVAAYRYMDREDLEAKVKANPEQYTEWFRMCVQEKMDELYEGIENVKQEQ